jgi:hypothetical protein
MILDNDAISLPIIAREWLCGLGFPRARTDKTNPRSLQAIYLAAEATHAVNERATKRYQKEPAGI